MSVATSSVIQSTLYTAIIQACSTYSPKFNGLEQLGDISDNIITKVAAKSKSAHHQSAMSEVSSTHF